MNGEKMLKRNFGLISTNNKHGREQNKFTVKEKIFTFEQDSNTWLLPDSSQVFSEDVWKKPDLQELKEHLNGVKSQLNQYPIEEWSQHTNKTDPAGNLKLYLKKYVKPEFLTGAWTKFYECLHSADNVIPSEAVKRGSVNSVHICEAPGAFVASLNHFLALEYPQLQWNWMASSLNPYYEGNDYSSMISDDRFMIHTIDNWEFGDDYTGNLMSWNNMDAIVKKADKMGKIDLVSADGSIDCSLQPEIQEEVVAQLIFCEIMLAFRLLSEGGNLVIKMFTMFEEKTISMVYMLCCSFNTVKIFKPSTSKEGNSEIYVTCLGFKNNISEEYFKKFQLYHENGEFSLKSIFSLKSLPEYFVEQHNQCVSYFQTLQCYAINNNINLYHWQNRKSNQKLYRNREEFVKWFIWKYKLGPITRLICETNYYQTEQTNIRYHFGSYDYRKQVQIDNDKQILELGQELEMLQMKLPNYEREILYSYNFDKQSIKIHLIYGKTVENVTSSKFLLGNYLVIYNKLCRLKSVNPFQNWGKKCDESYNTWEKRYYLQILEDLEKLEMGSDFVINDPLLLTQFSIGFLYLVFMQGFKSIVFNSNTVELQCLVSKDCFKEIRDIIMDNNCDKALLGLISLKQIRLGFFYSAVYTYNNQYFYNLLNSQLA